MSNVYGEVSSIWKDIINLFILKIMEEPSCIEYGYYFGNKCYSVRMEHDDILYQFRIFKTKSLDNEEQIVAEVFRGVYYATKFSSNVYPNLVTAYYLLSREDSSEI